MRIELKAMCLASFLLLAACGNAYERITVGEWTEVGKAEPPGPPPTAYAVETIHAGDGRVVKAGDLVEARLTKPGGRSTPKDIWIWVGDEPDFKPQWERTTSAWYGNLGSARFRRALIGRQLGEKFRLHGMHSPQGTDLVPVYAISLGNPSSAQLFQVIVRGEVLSSPEWPWIELAGPREAPEMVAEVEILQACQAKLYWRKATVTQWGIPFRFATGRPDNSRRGELGWSKIEANCTAGEGNLKVQAGPFYLPTYPDGNELLDWSGSYASMRPPSKFPEEWSAERARPGMR